MRLRITGAGRRKWYKYVPSTELEWSISTLSSQGISPTTSQCLVAVLAIQVDVKAEAAETVEFHKHSPSSIRPGGVDGSRNGVGDSDTTNVKDIFLKGIQYTD